jgi:4-amino-4-deoxy-L-arabinose transferase-like glycosyltransferase
MTVASDSRLRAHVNSYDRKVPTVALELFAARPVLLISAALFLLEIALAGQYGFHRDELYFLDCARHLQGGYVDQPSLIPLLARVSLSVFGVSLVGLRVWSALAVAVTVILGALLAGEFGGGRNAQILAAFATATMPVVIGVGHILEPTTLDIMFWAALALIVARTGRTGDCRYWLLAGLVLGLGLANKHSAGFFAAAIVLGALLSGGWRLVFNRWALAGAAITACFTIPDLWWQALHNWPTIAMTQTLNHENGGLPNIITWMIGQLLMVSLALVWIWIVGIGFLWRSERPL